MKNWILLALLILVFLILLPVLHRKPQTVRSSDRQQLDTSAVVISNALALQPSNVVAAIQSNFDNVQSSTSAALPALAPVPAPAGPPEPLQFTNFSPAIVVENMARAIRQYGDMFGGNPIGTNPEITSQLTGKNPRGINFLDGEKGMRVVEGQLVDAWGSPYFFHQLSARQMEIHSAGPDRVLWTSDDLILK